MATTNPDNIWTPDSGDDYALTTDLAATADTIQDALTRRANYYVGDSTDMAAQEANAPEGAVFYNTDDNTEYRMESGSWSSLGESPTIKYFRWADATERAAQTGMQAGDRGYQEDTGFDYYYDGSNWLVNLPGLNLIVPGSVSGATITGRGTVEFNGATTVAIDDVFSDRFRNYRVVLKATTSGSALLNAGLRSGGTDNTASVYDSTLLRGMGATPSSAQSLGSTFWTLSTSTGAGVIHLMSLDIYSPFASAATSGMGTISATENPMASASAVGVRSILHRSASSFTGLYLTVNTGTFTGTIQVYGYNE